MWYCVNELDIVLFRLSNGIPLTVWYKEICKSIISWTWTSEQNIMLNFAPKSLDETGTFKCSQ